MNFSAICTHKSEWPKSTLTFLVCFILFIWCIPNTIALRNSILLVGAINAGYLIYAYRHLFGVVSKNTLPLVLLSGLYIWAILHYQFFSFNEALELKELQSIWLRSLSGSLMALVLPICLVKSRRRAFFFFLFLFSTPIINIFLYFGACITTGYMITPQEYVAGFAFKKIETVFFGSIAMAIASANLLSLFSRKNDIKSRDVLIAVYWVLGIIICFISAVISNTKNGILMGLFIMLFSGGYFFLGLIRRNSYRMTGAVLTLGLIIFSVGTWKIHDEFSTGGWYSLVADVKTAIDVDRHLEWKTDNAGKVLPLNENGEVVSASTYMRVAWAVIGIRLIEKYPMGYGSINSSYDGLLGYESIDPGKHGQTHSGWVDFGLAYGIPGLLLLMGALICVLFLTPPNPPFWALQAFYIAATFFPLALIAEITWKQYFEASLFFLTYAAAIILMGNFYAESEPFKR